MHAIEKTYRERNIYRGAYKYCMYIDHYLAAHNIYYIYWAAIPSQKKKKHEKFYHLCGPSDQ